MLKIIASFCLTFAVTALMAQTTGSLQGKVTDVTADEGLPFANVWIEKNSVKITGTQTDFDGNYNFSNVEAGTYDVFTSYVGFPTLKKEGVIIKVGQVTRLDIDMEESTNALSEVVVQAYKIPLIEQDNTVGGQTLGAEDIKNLSTRSVTSIVSTTAGVNQADKGKAIRSRGARKSKNRVYLDGLSKNNARRKIGKKSKPKVKGYATTAPVAKPKPRPSIKTTKTAAPNNSTVPESTTEEYAGFVENEYKAVQDEPLSTFSIDVDRASYANVRRFLNNMQRPPKDAIRIEEMVNYFDYKYEQPTGEHPFNVVTEASDCPWNKEAKLVHIGLQGKNIDLEKAPASNLVFLLDVSGSMSYGNKLPLLKESLKLLVNNMRSSDKVAIVVYAGAAGLVLPSTNNKHKIMEALDKLSAGGSTAGGEGIRLAYKVAKEQFINDGNNRVILATDGDFNVGVSSDSDLETLITQKRNDDIFLTVLGFGMGNYKDSKMEILADKGNGNYAYIDNIKEAKKTLVNEMGGTLYTIAKDVKIQIEFNPAEVKSYRLVGYENRLLNKEDFNDDTKDAGELGAGHTVTALYEVVLAKNYKEAKTAKKVDDLKYQKTNKTAQAVNSNELMTVKLRYKAPKGTKSTLLEYPLKNEVKPLAEASENFRFAASVAGFGMLLRESKFKNDLTYKEVLTLAKGAKGTDKEGYRAEFIGMVKNVQTMTMHAKK